MLIIARMETRSRWHVLKMKSKNPPTSIHLSSRQRECLRLIAEGHTVTSAGYRLGISIRMVRVHLRVAREKLGAASTSHAVHIAVKLGLLE